MTLRDNRDDIDNLDLSKASCKFVEENEHAYQYLFRLFWFIGFSYTPALNYQNSVKSSG